MLENSGIIDPERIEDYIAHGGYSALVDALTLMMPAGVVQQVQRSGLRGRGGGGYPTGLKWSTVAKARAPQQVRHLQRRRGRPRRVHGSQRARERSAPRPRGHGHRRLRRRRQRGLHLRARRVPAGRQAPEARPSSRPRSSGLLGQEICGTTFNFKIDIRLGAGAFVCGEETALIASIEGNRGTPRPRPPYPAEVGPVGHAHADQQRRDLRQHRPDPAQRRRLVRRHRHGEEQGHQGLRARRPRRTTPA